MSLQQVKGLFPLNQAVIRLSAITAMNAAMTNVLLAALVLRNGENKADELIKVFKNTSLKIMDNVMQIAKGCKLKRAEVEEIQELANAYKSILEAIK